MLEAKDLCYRYGVDSPVLRDVTLRVADGERLVLLGASGRGKSTLALLLAGYLQLQQGTITLDGALLPKDCYNPVQLIYQHPEKAMDPRWKVGDTLREAWDVPEKLLTAIGAEPNWLTRWPHELSGGQLQRLSILRALSPKTRVLIADEITASLDPITQAQIWSVILREIEKNRTMLIAITHNEALAQRICTRMVYIEDLQE